MGCPAKVASGIGAMAVYIYSLKNLQYTVMMMMNDIIVMKREPIMVTAHRGMLSKKPQSSMALIISFGSFVVDAPPSPEVLIILLMTPWTI